MTKGVFVVNVTKRELALSVAEACLFRPYLWGGDDPMAGFDCSGFVIEVLKSVGILPREGDWTADGLRARFIEKQTSTLVPGVLVFWGKKSAPSVAGHVEMVHSVISSSVFTIGASGGGSKTDSLMDAIKHDAYIKIRPVRDGWFSAVNPFAL